MSTRWEPEGNKLPGTLVLLLKALDDQGPFAPHLHRLHQGDAQGDAEPNVSSRATIALIGVDRQRLDLVSVERREGKGGEVSAEVVRKMVDKRLLARSLTSSSILAPLASEVDPGGARGRPLLPDQHQRCS